MPTRQSCQFGPGEEQRVPTGVAIRDVRQQLFDATERVLLQDGANALTSRAVTTEAGCAKGVLHRHFADFDAFLAEFVIDRCRIGQQTASLLESAGTGTVTGNLTAVLVDVYVPVTLAIIRLIFLRDDLRTRLRQATGARIPVVTETTAMVASYLAAERDLGRVACDADVRMLAPTLIGAAHLVFTDREGTPSQENAIREVVTTVLATVITP